nr:putative late blight resistance protein homolog R1B-14 [Ipomoea batatas]
MGHEIAIWKLVCLWIAEGFIPTINEWEYRIIDAEEEAQKYLNDLIERNLVTLIKRRADGQIKTCRIHDTLHEFCKSEAARKKLFLVMDKEQSRLDENTCSARRLCFHSCTDDENKSSILLSPFGKHIHSLFLSSPQKSEVCLAPDELATIPNIFPLLRVLNIEYIEFINNMLPKEVYRLYLLKYIAISGNLNLLPKSFKNLVELETLVIKTTARTLQIVGGIWNMEKLRHVCTNTSAQLPFPPKTSKANSGGKNILTLSTISPESCTKEIFRRTPNLQKLGVRGNLSQLLEGKQETCLFNNLQLLKGLLNLKLYMYGKHNEGLTVPMLDKFACRLKKLSFSGTRFEWKDMRVLGLLEELEVLKLDDYAFKGENWELSNDVVFKRLQYLRIGKTNLKSWMVTENSFPTLRSLNLQSCSSLEKIPQAFAKVHTLKEMVLFNVRESATQSAKGVRESIKSGGFKLNITSVKRRVVINAFMKDQKDRNKAKKIAARFSGVESASIQENGHLEVIGDVDAVEMVGMLRKRLGQAAELISVGPVYAFDHPNTSTSSQEIVSILSCSFLPRTT